MKNAAARDAGYRRWVDERRAAVAALDAASARVVQGSYVVHPLEPAVALELELPSLCAAELAELAAMRGVSSAELGARVILAAVSAAARMAPSGQRREGERRSRSRRAEDVAASGVIDALA